jgi:membrane protein implicated in regulation of membrane protease activity
MQWWTWFVLGTLLLAIELVAIDAQFFLIFIGAAAIVVGLIGMLGINLPVWLQWLLFAALAVAAVVTMRKQIYAKLRNRPDGKVETDVHQLVRLPEELEPGKSIRLEYRGASWTALNVGKNAIPAGEEGRIDSVDGLTLRIRGSH